MTEENGNDTSPADVADHSALRAALWIGLSSIGLIFMAGAIFGFLSQHQSMGGGSFSAAAIGILALMAAITAALAYVIVRQLGLTRRAIAAQNRREQTSMRYLALFLAIGITAGIAFAILDPTDPGDAGAIFSSAPLPAPAAIAFTLAWGIAMPIAAWFWHTRGIDEHEAAAYRDGGYYAGYAYLCIAPLWWMLWRGGLLPPPDGVALYMGFALIWCAIWFWKKYV